MSQLFVSYEMARELEQSLRERTDIGDGVFQGIDLRSEGVIQGMWWRRTSRDQRTKQFVETIDGMGTAIETVVQEDDGQESRFFSMNTRPFRFSLFVQGVLHVASTGDTNLLIAKSMASRTKPHSLGQLGRYTGPQDGIPRIVGVTHMAEDSRHSYITRSQFLAHQGRLSADPRNPRPLTEKPFDHSFRDIGAPGVARAAFTTGMNDPADFDNQPLPFCLSPDNRPASLAATAEHLVSLLNPMAIALRHVIPGKREPSEQFVLNLG